jgi:AraC-like DNA-binding protein
VSRRSTKLQSAETAIFAEYPEIPGVEFLSRTHVADNFDAHMHDYFTFAVTHEGSEHFWCRGAEHVATLGDLALLNPYDVHEGGPGPEGCWSYSTIYARAEVLEAAQDELFKRSHRTLQFSTVVVNDPPVAVAVGALQAEMYRADSALERQSSVLSLLGVLVARYASVTAVPRKIQLEPLAVRKVRDFIHSNYADNVSLEDLSECSGLSPFHLLRTFRRAIGMPPHAYLRQIRVERAKHLLADGTPISEAAAAAGFVDQSHLNRFFKRILGMTPGAYAAATRSKAI